MTESTDINGAVGTSTVLARTGSLPYGEHIVDSILPAREPFSTLVNAGQLLSIVDLHGQQGVDFLVYDANNRDERYSGPETIAAQGSIFLSTGSVLRSNEGGALMTITHDDCGRHDTLGGACSKESNTLRYGHHTRHEHACVENFLLIGQDWGLDKRDLVSNINWYTNLPVEADGTLGMVDGLSVPGMTVTLRADRDVLVLISNCPQMNNPCNGFNPTPLRIVVTQP